MKWLGRIRVPYAVAAGERLRDRYDWHKALWLAFPGQVGQERDFLTRVDKKESEFVAYILSAHKPICPPWCHEDYWELIEIRDSFLNHEYYRFDLLANPTRKLAKMDADGGRTKNGRRWALFRPQEQTDWILRKAEQGGFRILEAPSLEIGKPQRIAFAQGHRVGTLFGVQFKGVLQVTDRTCFCETFHNGLGSAKGFGFGMMMLQPVTL
jgi:CRISPR system Cascade subunit CasE